jgi:glycosyltransferase involved in cell wall biosynthesis
MLNSGGKFSNKGILFLGFTIPHKLAQDNLQLDASPQFATYKFSWSFTRALKAAGANIVLASSVPIQSFPHSKSIIFRSYDFMEGHVSGTLIGFVNIVIFKHISRFFQCLYRLPRFIRLHNVDTMILHGTHTPFMIFAIVVKLLRNMNIFIILTDQHGAYVPGETWYERFLRKLDTKLMAMLLKQFDGYICLSNLFVGKFSLKKPILVVPGIVSSDVDLMHSAGHSVRNDSVKFKVAFVGGVNRLNGIDMLLEAFSLLRDSRFSLVIYGDGELREATMVAARNDVRIVYGGRISDDELISELYSASVLINPKPVDEEYAKTSFPSKLLEYLAIGRPVLTTRVVSIPPELADCFLYIDVVTPAGIALALRKAFQLPDRHREELAVRARQLVRKLYSEAVIGGKIISFVGTKGRTPPEVI